LTQEEELCSEKYGYINHDSLETMASKRHSLDGRTMFWKGYISKDPTKRSSTSAHSK